MEKSSTASFGACMSRLVRNSTPKADLYLLEYGRYYIAMNCGQRSYNFPVPQDFLSAKDLVTRKAVAKPKLKIKRGQTIVLFRN